jgi:outer membrane protein TolC
MASAVVILLLAGCASFSPDAGMEAVAGIAAAELKKDALKIDGEETAAASRARTRKLLASSPSADAAVQIALLNNRGLQAAYNELGIAEAAKVEASLPPNPVFSISRLSTPVELDIERRIAGDILALATLPARANIAADRFHQAQLRAAEETLRIAAEARRNYYRAVAARQLVTFLRQASSAAETAAKLAKQLGETGAMNKLDQAREQSFYVDITTQLIAARQHAASEREALIRSLGLWGNEIEFELPEMLPAVPRRPLSLPAVEIEAVRRRVDLHIARIEVNALAKSYGLTNATRFINLLDVAGVSRTQREAGGARGAGGGVEVEFQVPVFDLGEARLRQAGESYAEAVNRLTEKTVNVRSEARDAYRAYRSAYDIAVRYRDQALPLRQTITDETLLRYGAMQIDVFTLLTEARQRLAVNIAAIEAQRDFWLAAANLGAAVAGGSVAAGSDAVPHAAMSGSASAVSD